MADDTSTSTPVIAIGLVVIFGFFLFHWVGLLCYSILKSLFQAICCDIDGAKRTLVGFTQRCLPIGMFRSIYENIRGGRQASFKTDSECVVNLNTVLDFIPVVGLAKGVIHYACGDKDGGDNAMKTAFGAIGIMAGGVIGFAIWGDAGAFAGGIGGGVLMDKVILYVLEVDSAIYDEYRPAGVVKRVKDICKDPDAGKLFDLAFTVAAHSLIGCIAANIVDEQGGIWKTLDMFEAEIHTFEKGEYT